MNNYIIYYKGTDGEAEGFTAYGSQRLKKALKWLHSIGAQHITVYKEGPNFKNDPDDILETNYR